MRNQLRTLPILLLCLGLQTAALSAQSNAAPHFEKRGAATQLIVDGKPFLMLSGELHNSSSSDLEYMKPIWAKLRATGLNSVVTPLSWELIEPKEGAYEFALVVNTVFNFARRKLGLPYWSLSAYLKHKVKNAVDHISAFEHFIAAEARHHRADGIVCGHIHHAEIRMMGDILYCNDGDWVESCTALVEDYAGKLSIIRWADERDALLGALPAKPEMAAVS